ncbi:MAG: 30S ribosomal protein S6 [Spirochaetota bacterium]
MNKYELTVIVRNRETEATKEKVKEILQKNGASITLEDHWGSKKLSYEIDKEREAFYMFMNVEASPSAINPIEREFGLNSDILRHLFVKLPVTITA